MALLTSRGVSAEMAARAGDWPGSDLSLCKISPEGYLDFTWQLKAACRPPHTADESKVTRPALIQCEGK